MIYRNIAIPAFSFIGKNIFKNLIEIIKEQNFYFSNIAILTGNFGNELIKKYNIRNQFKKSTILNIYDICSISKLRSAIIREKVDAILTIGGGQVNDIGKYLSMETTIPLISIPTIISNDGIASPISIIRLNGKYKSVGASSPLGIIGDIDILKKSPEKYLLSGIGDLFSNISATYDWELSEKINNEKIDSLAKNMSNNASYLLLHNFLNNNYDTIYDDNLIKDLFNSLIISGISMIIAKSSRPASGAEHNLSHSMDKLFPDNSILHGIKVGFFTLFILYLHGQTKLLNDINEIYLQINFKFNFDKNKTLEILPKAKKIRKRFTILNRYNDNDIVKSFLNFLKDNESREILCIN